MSADENAPQNLAVINAETLSQRGGTLSMLSQEARTMSPENFAALAKAAIDLSEHDMKRDDWDADKKLNTAWNAALAEMPPIKKSTRGNRSDYAKLETIQAVIDPVLARHGLTVRVDIGGDKDFITATPVATHGETGREKRGATMTFPHDLTGKEPSSIEGGEAKFKVMSPVNAVVSATTYARRAALSAFCNLRLIGMDNDGERAQKISTLTKDEQDVIAIAKDVAKKGRKAYDDFYKSLSRDERALLGSTCPNKDMSPMMKNGKPVSYDAVLTGVADAADAKGNDNGR